MNRLYGTLAMNATSLRHDIDTRLSAAGASAAEAGAGWEGACAGGPPEAAALVQLGLRLQLDFHRVLALLLKHEYEQVLEQTLDRAEDAMGEGGAQIDLRLLQKRLNPDCDALFAALQAGGYVPNGFAYDARSLRDLVREMTLLDLHRVATDSPELQAFAERSRRSQALLQDCPGDLEHAYGAARREWLALQEELGERLLYLERHRLENENLTQRWLGVFGVESVALAEQAARVDGLQQRIELKLSQPAIDRVALEQRLAEADRERQSHLDRLRFRLAVALTDPRHPAGGVISAAEVGEYRRQSKQTLREIWLLIHPDKLAANAVVGRLTVAQKQLLADLWHRAMAVRAEEMGVEAGYLGHDYRSLSLLQDILAMVRAVLRNAGIDTDVALIVQGETVPEQLDWLRGSIQRLQSELDNVQAELLALLNDAKVQEQAAMLAAAPLRQKHMRQEMRGRADELAARAERMQAYLDGLFQPQGALA